MNRDKVFYSIYERAPFVAKFFPYKTKRKRTHFFGYFACVQCDRISFVNKHGLVAHTHTFQRIRYNSPAPFSHHHLLCIRNDQQNTKKKTPSKRKINYCAIIELLLKFTVLHVRPWNALSIRDWKKNSINSSRVAFFSRSFRKTSN